jgi:hypothetical protein
VYWRGRTGGCSGRRTAGLVRTFQCRRAAPLIPVVRPLCKVEISPKVNCSLVDIWWFTWLSGSLRPVRLPATAFESPVTASERLEYLLRLDDELLLGGVILSEWCNSIVREADIAFVHGAHLASILTAVSGIETYLRSEAREDGRPLVQLIDCADIDPALRADLHRLRKYRNRWVHVDAPWKDARVLSEPEHFENELEEMALFGARALRRTLYSDQFV